MRSGTAEGAQAPAVFDRFKSQVRQNAAHVLGCAAAGLVVAGGAFGVAVETSSTETELGGNRVIIEPTFDSRATAEIGPISLRTGVLEDSHGLGVGLAAKEASGTMQSYFDRTAQVVSKPYESITEVTEVVRGQLIRSSLWGLGIGIAAGYGVHVLRRHESRAKIIAGGTCIAAVAGLFINTRVDQQVEPAPWVQLQTFIPERYKTEVLKNIPPELQNAEIRGTPEGLSKFIDDFIEEKFVKPQVFVNKAWKNFQAVQSEKVPSKQAGEFRVGIISDMHDNTFMADLAGKTLNAMEADGLVVAGDTTSSGLKYEQFSAKSIANSTTNIQFRADIIGNHDTEASEQPFRDAKFVDLNDGKLKKLGPLTILGVRSNQYTALGRDTIDTGAPNEVVAQALADEACAQDTGVDLTVVHEPVLGDRVALQGCTEIVVAGHMHDQVSPTLIQNQNSTTIYRMINGTTGGAEAAFTFGEPVNPADITVLTYAIGTNEQPVFTGWQHVRYFRSGRVELSDFMPVAPTTTRQDIKKLFSVPVGTKAPLK